MQDFTESAKSRALRALVSYAPRALRALVSRVLRTLVPYVPRALHALVPNVPHALRALVHYVPYVPRAPRAWCHTCSCVSRASSSMWACASCFMSPFSLRSLLFRTLRTLFPNITFCALEFPWIMLLFSCSFATCDLYFWKITKVKTNIVCQ